jgi:peptidyl-prolyl cis-trans isomerase B (cyclophilin B)
MKQPESTHTMLLRIIALWLSAWSAAAGFGQDPADEGSGALCPLRAEATVARTLFDPAEPVPVRFTLFNPTSEPVEVPVTRAEDEPDGITLPRSVIIGTADQPALFITYESEKPVAVEPNPDTHAETQPGVLRLAPRAAVGTQIDLRSVYRLLRYSGDYRLDWQPLNGRIAAVELSFRVEPQKEAVLSTDYGNITFSLAYDKAPRNVENFLELARQRFYDRKTIHRIIPGFIIQGGSPDGSETGIRPDGRFVPAEFHGQPFEPGTLAMARKPNEPDSASCQFFISLARLKELDGKYTVIGQAHGEESFRTLQAIEQLPTDRRGCPIRPVRIRSISLIDALASQAQELKSRGP